MNVRALLTSTAVAAVSVASLSACSLVGGDDTSATDGGAGSGSSDGPGSVVLLTHSDFSLPDEVVADFERESGYDLEIRPTDGVATLTNSLVEQAGSPSGDVAFGVDNTFASRALDGGAFTAYDGTLPPGAADHLVPGDDGDGGPAMVPVDDSDVCVNVDDAWFDQEGIDPPETLDDLTDPAYRGLFVTPSASYSSPGMAFLLSTVAAYGDDWSDYWADLVDNDALVVKDWSNAYYDSFTQGGGDGDRPIVLSYDTSPAFTIAKDGSSTTHALLDTCFGQVEYAGVLDGAANPDGARELIDFMLGPEVQQALPDSMYVYPVVDGTTLPADWAKFAQQPGDPFTVDPEEIETNREDWLREWTDVISR